MRTTPLFADCKPSRILSRSWVNVQAGSASGSQSPRSNGGQFKARFWEFIRRFPDSDAPAKRASVVKLSEGSAKQLLQPALIDASPKIRPFKFCPPTWSLATSVSRPSMTDRVLLRSAVTSDNLGYHAYPNGMNTSSQGSLECNFQRNTRS